MRRIGAGGMGEVFFAWAYGVAQTRKPVVVKVLRSEMLSEPGAPEMFVEEGRLSLRLSHSNVLHVFDFGKADDRYFMAMEYVDGFHLGELRKKSGGKLAPEHACFVAMEVCLGLDYAHRLKDDQGRPLHIVHRDVTPSNVLISGEGEVKLADFGIARAVGRSQHTQAGQIRGKVRYMSPEAARGVPLDPRADIFSLGAVLFEMLTGRRAFDAKGGREKVLQQVVSTRTPAPSGAGAVTAALDEVVLRATAPDREERYADAFQMHRAIEAACRQAGLIPSRGAFLEFLRSLGEKPAPSVVSELVRITPATPMAATPGASTSDSSRSTVGGTPAPWPIADALPARTASVATEGVPPPVPPPLLFTLTAAAGGIEHTPEVVKLPRFEVTRFERPPQEPDPFPGEEDEPTPLPRVVSLAGSPPELSEAPTDRHRQLSQAETVIERPEGAYRAGMGAETVPVPVERPTRPSGDDFVAENSAERARWRVRRVSPSQPGVQGFPEVKEEPPGAWDRLRGELARRPLQTMAGVAVLALAIWGGIELGGGPTRQAEPIGATFSTPFAVTTPRPTARSTPPVFHPSSTPLRVAANTPRLVVSRPTPVVRATSPPPSTPPPMGMLDINSDPWSEVSFNGRRLGNTPLQGVRLPAGRQVISFRNPRSGKVKTVEVEIRPGANRPLLEDLTSP